MMRTVIPAYGAISTVCWIHPPVVSQRWKIVCRMLPEVSVMYASCQSNEMRSVVPSLCQKLNVPPVTGTVNC